MTGEILGRTVSVCPVCLRNIPAFYAHDEKGVFLNKNCEVHGEFSSVVWRDLVSFEDWLRDEPEPDTDTACPGGCAGLCSSHMSETCCVLLEVTKRCDLGCAFCFADGRADAGDISFERLADDIRALAVKGETLLQLSGGEPTLREDLPRLIEEAKKAGCEYVQLNTNGIRLGTEQDYARVLKEAGLSFVFMQFDGVTDEVNRKLRGRDLLEIKKRAIENCSAALLGVTLVPTLVPGVNTGQIGDILRFAAGRSPAVRGVHFQPVSYFGRTPRQPKDEDRFTLDELIDSLYSQTAVGIPFGALLPSCCDHSLCGFHGDFIVTGDKTLYPLHNGPGGSGGCRGQSPAELNREFVARRWQREETEEISPCAEKKGVETCGCADNNRNGAWDFDEFYHRIRNNGFTLSAMAFQDVWNIDAARLRECSLHVFDGGRHIPFCVYYNFGPAPT